MTLGVRLLLAHEMPNISGEDGRHGVEFATFFACEDGATDARLLKAGIYARIAVPLKGGRWRPTSMAMLARAMFEHFEGTDPVSEDLAETIRGVGERENQRFTIGLVQKAMDARRTRCDRTSTGGYLSASQQRASEAQCVRRTQKARFDHKVDEHEQRSLARKVTSPCVSFTPEVDEEGQRSREQKMDSQRTSVQHHDAGERCPHSLGGQNSALPTPQALPKPTEVTRTSHKPDVCGGPERMFRDRSGQLSSRFKSRLGDTETEAEQSACAKPAMKRKASHKFDMDDAPERSFRERAPSVRPERTGQLSFRLMTNLGDMKTEAEGSFGRKLNKAALAVTALQGRRGSLRPHTPSAPIQEESNGTLCPGQLPSQPPVVENLSAAEPPYVAIVAASPPEAPLREGWTQLEAPDGRTYYYHKASNVSQWERPEVEAAEQGLPSSETAAAAHAAAQQRRRQHHLQANGLQVEPEEEHQPPVAPITKPSEKGGGDGLEKDAAAAALFPAAEPPSAVVVAASPPEVPLCEGWTPLEAPDGRTYYYHKASNVTQWERPEVEAAEQGLALSLRLPSSETAAAARAAAQQRRCQRRQQTAADNTAAADNETSA